MQIHNICLIPQTQYPPKPQNLEYASHKQVQTLESQFNRRFQPFSSYIIIPVLPLDPEA